MKQRDNPQLAAAIEAEEKRRAEVRSRRQVRESTYAEVRERAYEHVAQSVTDLQRHRRYHWIATALRSHLERCEAAQARRREQADWMSVGVVAGDVESWKAIGVRDPASFFALTLVRDSLRMYLELEGRAELGELVEASIRAPRRDHIMEAFALGVQSISTENAIFVLYDLAALGLIEMPGRLADALCHQRLSLMGTPDPPAPPRTGDTPVWIAYVAGFVWLHDQVFAASTRDAVVASGNLALIDDLIDVKQLGAQHLAHAVRPEQVVYAVARTAPKELSDDQVAALDWKDEAQRRAFVGQNALPSEAGPATARFLRLEQARDGDVAALRELATAGSAAANELLGISTGADPGDAILADRSTWPTALHLIGDRPYDRSSAFATWALTVRMHSLLRMGDLTEADKLAAAVKAKQSGAQEGLRHEATAVRAYVRAARAKSAADVREVVLRLKGLPESAAKRDIASWCEAAREDAELRLNELPNPYFILGLPTGSPDWHRAWKRLRSETKHDRDRAALVNLARDTLDPMKGQPPSRHFTIPISPASLSTVQPGGLFEPSPTPLPRRSSPFDAAHLDGLRLVAAAELVDMICRVIRGER